VVGSEVLGGDVVVDRSDRPCLLCGKRFRGRTFLCRECADRYRGRPVPAPVRQQFYEQIDRIYPDWSNTYGQYNPPHGLLKFVETLPRSAKVLEIGAGGGFTLEALRERGFTHLLGSDLTATTLAEMRRRLAPIDLAAADAESLPFADEAFDVLISSDVVEHLPDLNQHMAEAARVLVVGGRYLFKTPNRLIAEQYYRLRGLYDSYFWHPSMSSPREIRALLARHGFDTNFLPAPRLTDAQLRKIPVRRLRPIAARFPMQHVPIRLRPHLEIVATLRTRG
jgi:SAM-dependent methyltransferase